VHVFDATAPVAAGHYQPAARTLAEIETLAAGHGNGQLVLVQPSVYGSDNRVLLDALHASSGRHRGVVVVDVAVGDAELEAMHEAGVRGVRFNLVSPVGQRGWPGDALAALQPKLKGLHWHVQWYAQPADLPAIARWHATSGIVCVLDHLAGVRADTPADDPAWGALAQLAGLGAWLKLSGWYRLGAEAPYASLDATIERAARLFGDRLLWGSDWPHTSFGDRLAPDYATLWQRVPAVLGEAAAGAARLQAPVRLYG
jgi:predicted TIM-barrel fold metal-dependent hydrolase